MRDYLKSCVNSPVKRIGWLRLELWKQRRREVNMFEIYLGNRVKRIYFMDWMQGVKELKVLADFCHE